MKKWPWLRVPLLNRSHTIREKPDTAMFAARREEDSTALTMTENRSVAERLAVTLGLNSGAKIVFAEPVANGGVTVIPVAKARYGFGGGGGRNEENQGNGGGGFVRAFPMGYIELKNGGSAFRRIRDSGNIVRGIIAAGFVSMLVLRQLSRRSNRQLTRRSTA